MIFLWGQRGEQQQQQNHSNRWNGYFREFPVHILRNHNSASQECGLLVSKLKNLSITHCKMTFVLSGNHLRLEDSSVRLK